jgi:D-arabinose 5-phosphate isomerase GutQ
MLGDAPAMVLAARGCNKEDFAKFHPGGMIGRSMLTRPSSHATARSDGDRFH